MDMHTHTHTETHTHRHRHRHRHRHTHPHTHTQTHTHVCHFERRQRVCESKLRPIGVQQGRGRHPPQRRRHLRAVQLLLLVLNSGTAVVQVAPVTRVTPVAALRCRCASQTAWRRCAQRSLAAIAFLSCSQLHSSTPICNPSLSSSSSTDRGR